MKLITVRTTWIRETTIQVPDDYKFTPAEEDEWVDDEGAEWTLLHDWTVEGLV